MMKFNLWGMDLQGDWGKRCPNELCIILYNQHHPHIQLHNKIL